MIECPACGHRLRVGTLFCTRCGVHVSTGATLVTEPLPEEEAPTPAADSWLRIVEGIKHAELPAGATRLRITVARSGRQVLFPLPIDEITLGRYDAHSDVSPELDLAPDGGFIGGVSRRHARITQKGDRLFVEDLGSANGTFLNDVRLMTDLPYPLQAGDVLQLARLEVLVEFE